MKTIINILTAIVAFFCFLVLVGENGPEMSVLTLIVWKVIAAAIFYGCFKLAERLNPEFFEELEDVKQDNK